MSHTITSSSEDQSALLRRFYVQCKKEPEFNPIRKHIFNFLAQTHLVLNVCPVILDLTIFHTHWYFSFFVLSPSHDFIGDYTTSYRELARGQSQFNVYEVSNFNVPTDQHHVCWLLSCRVPLRQISWIPFLTRLTFQSFHTSLFHCFPLLSHISFHGWSLLLQKINMKKNHIKNVYKSHFMQRYKGHICGICVLLLTFLSYSSVQRPFLLLVFVFSISEIYAATIITWKLTQIEMQLLAVT